MKKKAKADSQAKEKKGRINIFKVDDRFNFGALLKNLALPLIGGILIGFFIKNSTSIYNGIKKPVFAPPPIVFPIVWTILYVLMGIAAYRIYMKNTTGINDDGAYFYYLVQLCINFLWPFVFFSFRLYGISFIILVTLLILVVLTTLKFRKVDKTAAYLMIPYILWLCYAGVLNYFVWVYNEM